ncbi:MAG: transposase [Rhodobacterales bacterium]|nr:MAG: transposase [Rhodobacterales bacterium]
MPTTLLTDIAEAKITAAAGSGTAVAITHIALGDGNGANYAPSYSQTALQRELARQAIQTRHIVGTNAWRVKAEFDPDTPAFAVREMGFFDADGDLIAVWAGNDVVPRQTGSITYLVDHVLSFTRVEAGLVIVNAPDDDLFDAVVAQGRSIFLIFSEQMRQARAIEALQAKET